MPANESRLIRIEEDIYFLEEHVREMDRQIAAQQAQIAALEKMVNGLSMRLRELLAQMGDGKIANEPPPHYLPYD